MIHTAYRQDGEGARETTVDGAGAVARAAAAAVGARLVHMSSDVIFDGTKPTAYDELDPPSPITDYGRAKADAEHAVAEAHPGALLVRTSLIYGHGHSRHERLALEAARGEGELAFFDDEMRCPVAVDDLAAALLELVDRAESGVLNVARRRGGEPLRVRVPRGRRGRSSDRSDPARVDRGVGPDPAAQLHADERASGRAAPHPPARTRASGCPSRAQ